MHNVRQGGTVDPSFLTCRSVNARLARLTVNIHDQSRAKTPFARLAARHSVPESNMLRQESGRSTPSSDPDESHTGNNGLPDGPIDNAWVNNLVAGWMKKYFDPLLESDEVDFILLFQGHLIDQFDAALDRRIEELTQEGKLPILQPGEIYASEYTPVIGQAFEDAEAEVGWCPMNQSISRTRK